jgi:hypothetical protein
MAPADMFARALLPTAPDSVARFVRADVRRGTAVLVVGIGWNLRQQHIDAERARGRGGQVQVAVARTDEPVGTGVEAVMSPVSVTLRLLTDRC